MQLVSTIEDGNCIIKVTGTLTFTDHKKWQQCKSALKEGAGLCILDLRELDKIDSVGLSLILSLRTWVEREDMTLKLQYDTESFVGSMMRLVRFDAMLLTAE